MSMYRTSIFDLLIVTAVVAIFVVVNLQPTDIGSGVAIDAIGWPTKFYATTMADILETTTGKRTHNVKIALFFDWRNLTINVSVAVLVAIATAFGFQLIRRMLNKQDCHSV